MLAVLSCSWPTFSHVGARIVGFGFISCMYLYGRFFFLRTRYERLKYASLVKRAEREPNISIFHTGFFKKNSHPHETTEILCLPPQRSGVRMYTRNKDRMYTRTT